MKPLSYDEKIGLLYEAHAAMIELLDSYFGGYFSSWEREISDFHLRLRLLIEDLISDEELARLKARYFCPFETLSGLEDPTPFLRVRIGSDKWKSSRRRLDSFQGTLTELHIRAGSPGCPDVEAYKTVIGGLRQMSRGCRSYSDADILDCSEEQLDKLFGQIRKVVAKIRAGFVGIEHRRMKLRPVEQEAPRAGISTEKQEEVNKYGYKCRDRVHFPGISRKGRNVVVVNEQEVMMGDWPFILLLRLAVELLRDPEGWVHRQNLIDESLLPDKPDDRLHKRASDLRQRLRGYLLQRDDKDFIENDGERRYRICTAPGNITYDRNRLRKHGWPRVANLAKRLPRSRRHRK